MTQDEIIRMAIDAGLGEYLHLDGWRFTPDGDDIKSLERFYELAYATGAAHEREACAKVCGQLMTPWDENTPNGELIALRNDGMRQCAEAIRSRNEK